MAILPAVDQFPSFMDTLSWLTNGAGQCIWYLPDRGRYCIVGISPEANQSAVLLAMNALKPDPITGAAHGKLIELAEQSCCGRHHRNKMWGSGLGPKLALRWQQEVRVVLGIPMEPSVSAPRAVVQHKPVRFAKHELRKGDTLISQLLSSIDHGESMLGSVYMFTYSEAVFSGMIKIGYTSQSLPDRMVDWTGCGHGHPLVSMSWPGVQNPKRVETLIHFELAEHWYAQRWCENHRRPHIEWFKIDVVAASSVARLWSQWMKRANPYDRRGQLKRFWRETIDFLIKHQVSIKAKVMVEIQDLEEDSSKLLEFLDDDLLRKRQGPLVRQEQISTSEVIKSPPTLTELVHNSRATSNVNLDLVKKEVEKRLNSS